MCKIKVICIVSLCCLLFSFLAGCGADSQGESSIDVDLTAMSTIMASAEMNQIMSKPAGYMGKTIKLDGSYYAMYYEVTGLHYHYVVIDGADACCIQGLEFSVNADLTYPDDYPADGTRIELEGIFGSYEELGETWYYLAVDEIVVSG